MTESIEMTVRVTIRVDAEDRTKCATAEPRCPYLAVWAGHCGLFRTPVMDGVPRGILRSQRCLDEAREPYQTAPKPGADDKNLREAR